MSAASFVPERRQNGAETSRLGPADWLRAGLDRVALQGVAGLRIGSLAAELGVTGGSFYWHFKNRECFLDAVLRYWLERVVTRSLRQIAAAHPSGKVRLSTFVNEVKDLNSPDYERAVWSWALTDERAAKRHEQAGRVRIARLSGWFAQEGFPHDEAQLRSELLYRGWLAQKVEDRSPAFPPERTRQYLDVLLH